MGTPQDYSTGAFKGAVVTILGVFRGHGEGAWICNMHMGVTQLVHRAWSC